MTSTEIYQSLLLSGVTIGELSKSMALCRRLAISVKIRASWTDKHVTRQYHVQLVLSGYCVLWQVLVIVVEGTPLRLIEIVNSRHDVVGKRIVLTLNTIS